ncbi:MAG: GDP-L-fucose synthase [Croceibacterium sp.]
MTELDRKFNLAGRRVFVAGHGGMVGSAVVRRLQTLDLEVLVSPRKDVDLREQAQARDWFARHRPDVVILAAAKVGGIVANNAFPADFLFDNLMIQSNIIEAASQSGVAKLLFLGSSCIYPKFAEQPIIEEALLTAPLEPTNEWYAIAKIAGIKLCQAYRRQHGCDFISAMPTNLYGPGDNFDLESSHVIPALIRKAHEAKEAGARTMEIWGSGTPRREFLHVDDLADACVYLLENYSAEMQINVGYGRDVTIAELAGLVAEVVGFGGDLTFDAAKPDGTPRKLLSSARLNALGWRARIDLRDGLADAYAHYLQSAGGRRRVLA